MAVEIAIPFAITADGGVAVETLPNRQIFQHVRSLIATSRTERAMLTGYGCSIVDQLFEPGDDTVETEVSRQVSEGLRRYEPSLSGATVRPVRNVSGDGIANVEVRYARTSGAVTPTASTPAAQLNSATIKVGGRVLEAVHG